MRRISVLSAGLIVAAASTSWAGLTDSLKPGKVDIKQAGALAFGPDGVLFVADAQQGAIFAIATDDAAGDPSKIKIDVKGIDQQIAAMLGATPADIVINDVAVNPASANTYLSITRGRGAEATPALIRVDGAGKLSDVKLDSAKFSKASLGNIQPAAANQRTQSITDLAFVGGNKVIVAGLSNEEFASKLWTLDFPFKEADKGASVEIFHGNHGAVETRSPVRSFTTLDIKGVSTVLAGYTCTPLVTFPVASLKTGEKVRGTTIAELGNRNTPFDMISYKKDEKEYLLVANSARGVMKLATDGIPAVEPINARVPDGTAGLKFENVAELINVAQLDKLNASSAVLLVTAEGNSDLRTIALP